MKFWYVGFNTSHNVNYHCILNEEVVINFVAVLQRHLCQPWEQYEKCLDKIMPYVFVSLSIFMYRLFDSIVIINILLVEFFL